MIGNRFENVAYAWQKFKQLLTIPGGLPHGFHVAIAQTIDARSHLALGEALMPQSLANNLQVGHAGNLHLMEATCRAKYIFEHRDCVILECARSNRPNQRAINVPE